MIAQQPAPQPEPRKSYAPPDDSDNGYGHPQLWNPPEADQRFIDERLVRNQLLLDTEIKWHSIDYLDTQANSQGFVDFYKKVIMSLFDPSKILSKLDTQNFDIEEALIRARILLNIGKVHYETFDLDTPLALTLPETIILDYKHFLTRAVGGWERELQGKVQFSQDSTQTSIIKDMRPGQKPKGRFFGLLG